MNEHEAQRIAAAIHAARPDWPTASILTLLRTKLADRPRRDVFVALAWVASEADSQTPARVMESGPWWRAAGTEGTAGRRMVGPPCVRCGYDEFECTRRWATDHKFAGPDDWMRRRPTDPGAIAEATGAARDALERAKTAATAEPDLRPLVGRDETRTA